MTYDIMLINVKQNISNNVYEDIKNIGSAELRINIVNDVWTNIRINVYDNIRDIINDL